MAGARLAKELQRRRLRTTDMVWAVRCLSLQAVCRYVRLGLSPCHLFHCLAGWTVSVFGPKIQQGRPKAEEGCSCFAACMLACDEGHACRCWEGVLTG